MLVRQDKGANKVPHNQPDLPTVLQLKFKLDLGKTLIHKLQCQPEPPDFDQKLHFSLCLPCSNSPFPPLPLTPSVCLPLNKQASSQARQQNFIMPSPL